MGGGRFVRVVDVLAGGVFGRCGGDGFGDAAEAVVALVVDPLGSAGGVHHAVLSAEGVVVVGAQLLLRVEAGFELVEAVVRVLARAGVWVGLDPKTPVVIELEAGPQGQVVPRFDQLIEGAVNVVARFSTTVDVVAVDVPHDAPSVVSDHDILATFFVDGLRETDRAES